MFIVRIRKHRYKINFMKNFMKKVIICISLFLHC